MSSAENTPTTCQLRAFGMLAGLNGLPVGAIPRFEDTDALRSWLHAQCPELVNKVYALALNRELIQSNTPIPEGAEIALLPPFSGG
jgi:molybdopterin synthase sulfur carrier subunit